jgi:hypothetical protein
VKLIDNIKRNTGLKALSKSLRSVKRNKYVHNLVTARKVAIIGVVNNTKDFDDITNLQKFLTEKNMQVEVLVYFPGKEIPQQLLMRRGINIFNRNEVNWYGKPLLPFVEQFCKVEYDILIDLSMNELFPIRWIATLSRSRFKVGSLSYAGNPYELIITVDNNKEISYLTEQIIHYLNLLNNRFAQEQEKLLNTEEVN